MIGVFDSGVGGLGVLSQIRTELPDADILYAADQARAPYGTRTLGEVADAAEQVTTWLLDQGAEMIVVACNTASAAALDHLRRTHPETEFVGMEPAVKPAALTTTSGVIGVLATEATFQGELFSSVVRRHATETTVITAACPDWVSLVERHEIHGARAKEVVADRVEPLLELQADCLVLGCTHFPFLTELISEVAGSDVIIIDPAPAVARQVRRVQPTGSGGGSLTLATSGNPDIFAEQARHLIGFASTETVLALPRYGDSHLI